MVERDVLSGKVAVVTGAGKGIGRAIAIAYGEAGAAVCCAARSEGEIGNTAAAIEAAGGRALAVPTDVSDEQAVAKLMARAAEAFGGIDIVVINAGGIWDGRKPVAESDPDGWRMTLEVNLFGAYYCARAAIPYLKARGAGKIITIGSGVGHRGSKGMSAYAVSKAGLWMLTRVLAQELAEHRISVNELIPGPVATALNQNATVALAAGDAAERDPGGEWIKVPEEVAPLALFMATQPDHGPTAQSFSLLRRDN